jgi:hypothetical protein
MISFRRISALAAMIIGIATCSYGMGINVLHNDKLDLNIGGRIQLAGYGEYVTDYARSNGRVYLFLKQARLNINGQVDGIKYNTEWVGAAEDVNGSNNGLTLLDYSFDVPVYKTQSSWFKIGQFKVPYGREMITDEGQYQFVDNSPVFKGFNLGRDVGMAVHSYKGNLAGTFGVFTGGSRDVPLRFLPEKLGVPMLVTRFGYNDGADKDIYTVAQNDLNPQRTTKAAFINVMYFKDSEVGHSTVLGARTSEKSWLTNGNWNPFITKGAPVAGSPATPSRIDGGSLFQAGWDATARGKFASGLVWSTEAQMDYGRFSNDYGRLDLSGARIQGGLLKNKVEFAMRGSIVLPDSGFAATYGGRQNTGPWPIYEIAPAVTYYVRGHDFKIVADAPLLFDVPVFVENNVGTYVSTEQPDQSTVNTGAKGFMERQNIPEIRMMIQLAF